MTLFVEMLRSLHRLPSEVEQIPVTFLMQLNDVNSRDIANGIPNGSVPFNASDPEQYKRAEEWFRRKNSPEEKRKRTMLKLFGREFLK